MDLDECMMWIKSGIDKDTEIRFSGGKLSIKNETVGIDVDLYIAKGNRKLPKNYWIINTGSGTDCVGDLKGLCDYGAKNGDGSCYCLKAEKQYPKCLKCRRRNEKAFDYIVENHLEVELIYGILLAQKQARNKMIVLRFNESGEIKTDRHLDLMDVVAKVLMLIGVRSMVYTHRHDFYEYMKNIKHLVINGSDFMVHNEFRRVEKFSGKHLKCCGDCGICEKANRAYCTYHLGEVIEVIKH